DAVFVASDTMASGALQALRDAGLRAPDDVAVFGFDGREHQLVAQPVLSTMIQPGGCLGREAVKIVLDRLNDPERAPVQRSLTTQMALRASRGCAGQPALAETDEEQGGVPA